MSFFPEQRNIERIPLWTICLCCIMTASTMPSVDVLPSPVATVTEGAVLWLTCRYDLDGGTLGQLLWTGNDGGTAATAAPTATPPCSTLSPDNYSIDCNLASDEVRLGILNPVHGDTYSCSVYLSDFTLIGPVSTQVSVIVPVTSVTFSSPVSDTVTVTPGNSQVYTCVTGSCRPQARIEWYKNGVNVTVETGSASSDGDRFVTTSSFILTGAKGDSPATIQCRALNVNGMTSVQSGVKRFVVEWPPDGPPVISGYQSAAHLYANETLSLSCRQQGGNPLSTLIWTDLCRLYPATDGNTATETVSTITINVTKSYNKGMCGCLSSHPQLQVQDKTQVTFTVHYPPSNLRLNLTPTHPWLEGESGTLSCSYTEGFPAPARVEWFRNGLLTGQSVPSITLTSLIKADNRAGYSCRVRNDFTDVKHTNLTSSVTYLNVEYKPLVTLTPTYLTVVEGQTAQVTCDAEGNPTPTVEWLRGGTSVKTGTGTSLTLTLEDIDRSATDNYTCQAEGMSSVQGRQLITQRVFYLQVQYPPDVMVVVPPVEEGNTDIKLMCQTVGEPNTLTSQSWTQTIGQTLIADQFTYETTTPDTIVLSEVSFDDTGTYKCSVSNGIADRQGQTLQSNSAVLNVQVSPKYNSSGQNHKFYSRLHEPATIKILFYSNPPVTSNTDLEWTNLTSGARIIPSVSITFALSEKEPIDLSIKGRTVTFSGQAAVMTLQSFDKSFAGDYNVTVYNDGRRRHSATTFSITPSGPPEMPTDFQEVGTTTTSITVQWTKGFNGGHTQTFVILYRLEGGTRTETLSVKEQQQSTYTTEITGLKPNTRYQLNMYAFNEEGNSTLSSVKDISSETQDIVQTADTIAVIAGGVGGAIVFLLIITAVVVILYRRSNAGGAKGSSQRSDDALYNPDLNEDGDGMKRNILYESAGPYRPECQQAENTVDRKENGDKRKNIEGAEYAEVIPKKDRKVKTEKAQGNGDVYAEVDKRHVDGKKKKEMEKEKKRVEKGKKKLNKNPTEELGQVGTVYENIDAVGGKPEELYANSADNGKPVKPTAEQQMPSRKKNQDGLVYLDMDFKEAENGTRQVVIHGIENRNEYALVDFTKNAEPLPEGDDRKNEASVKN